MAPKSYYKTIAGVKYDRELLEMAEKAAADGQVSVKEAQDLWKAAQDGRGVTKIERRTLEYVLKDVKFTDKAAEYLKGELKGKDELGKSNGGYYKIVDGVKYDRELLEQAEQAAKDGQISVGEARALWESALDGHGVTNTEKLTLEHVLKAFKCTKPAKEFLEKELLTVKVKPDEIDESMPDAAVTAKVEPAQPEAVDEDLPDFDEDEPAAHAEENQKDADTKKGGYAAIHASGFRDFLLKPELLRAIVDCGFEHPSEVQHECIPQAILGTDILCQAKSGMGKTAVFVLACLQQSDVSEKAVKVLVICHTRELAYQIKHEFDRFAKYFADLKTGVVYGGVPISQDKEMLKDGAPHILIGTPGRLLGLIREKDLKLDKVTQFVLDECDKCLDKIDMRKDIQQIFVETPRKKQVMMFSATMSSDTRQLCKKFMSNPHEISVDEESKLTLHGLLQYYKKITEQEKNRKLNDLLDALEFNQVVVFVKSVQRAIALDKLLIECNFPSIAIHSGLNQEDRIARYRQFKEFQKRILVSTDLFGRGMDIERVNIVINYDMPDDSDTYLHRVGRAGRFGTKGLAITFVASDEDADVLKKVQERFEVNIGDMPSQIDTTSYLNA
mmetsp:Transcript_757/g.924  ORF Transcript_757/g.924 Transcript_757/m.924 type:complete len:614 (+) Transcript_757:67-1908(+)